MSLGAALFSALKRRINEAIRIRLDGSPEPQEWAMLAAVVRHESPYSHLVQITNRLAVVHVGEVAFAVQWRGDSFDVNMMTREAVDEHAREEAPHG